MERFYRYMRVKHRILVDELDQPFFGHWNLDKENRDKLPANHLPTPPRLFDNDLGLLHQMIVNQGIPFIGSVDAKHFIWPINRTQALDLVDFFVEQCLPLFGRFEDAMSIHSWSVYHSRLSFAMNLKMISPLEVVQRAIHHWEKNQSEISPNQLEGFVRQIIGWREYMRGVYWSQMPGFAHTNALNHDRKLPNWFWTGDTKMNCLKHAINQSLNFAYAHHIQRLMVTGNFALLAGIHPDEVDQWYLGIYIDAIEWVEITNTRGMSQYADGGFVATKPYVSSAAYIDKMSDYCKTCFYNKSLKTGEKSCPFNSLYWHFLERHRSVFEGQFRMKMMYAVLNKMKVDQRSELMVQAEKYLDQIESL
jgi:deoxyribodipyrimidine photolyase-related protein